MKRRRDFLKIIGVAPLAWLGYTLMGKGVFDVDPKSYQTVDLSGQADARNSFVSNVIPKGTLVHTSSGINSLDWLLHGSAQAGRPASADLLITRGGLRYALCPPGRRPYHAGRSRLELDGRVYKNDEVSAILMGVELEQIGDELVTFPQLDSLAELIVLSGTSRGWRWPYSIWSHYDVAVPTGRRSDPQGFDYGAFMGFLYTQSKARGVPGL